MVSRLGSVLGGVPGRLGFAREDLDDRNKEPSRFDKARAVFSFACVGRAKKKSVAVGWMDNVRWRSTDCGLFR